MVAFFILSILLRLMPERKETIRHRQPEVAARYCFRKFEDGICAAKRKLDWPHRCPLQSHLRYRGDKEKKKKNGNKIIENYDIFLQAGFPLIRKKKKKRFLSGPPKKSKAHGLLLKNPYIILLPIPLKKKKKKVVS